MKFYAAINVEGCGIDAPVEYRTAEEAIQEAKYMWKNIEDDRNSKDFRVRHDAFRRMAVAYSEEVIYDEDGNVEDYNTVIIAKFD